MGQRLATSLSKRFVDTDQLFVAESGRSIEKAVDLFGWDYFRQKEKDIIGRICKEKDQVVATGGGAILNSASVVHMKQSGTLIWLRAREDTIVRRMSKDLSTPSARPSLTDTSPVTEVKVLMAQRLPYYRQAADFEVITDDRAQESITIEIVKRLSRLSKKRSGVKGI